MHDVAFDKLVTELDEELSDWRAMKITKLLSKFKTILKDDGYKDYDSYTTQKLKDQWLFSPHQMAQLNQVLPENSLFNKW